MKLTLKTMLKGTAVCALLTLIWYFFNRFRPRVSYLAEFELIAAWVVVLIGWFIYLAGLFRSRKKMDPQ